MKKLLVGLFAVAMVVAFTAPAMAADWNFYGSARMSTFSDTSDISADDDERVTTWALQGNSRVGAKVKANDNGIGGRFEYGSGPNLRLLYGTWDFGGGELLIGQTYTPTTDFISNQVWGTDMDLIGWGMPYGGRQPMIRLKTGGFQVALVTPKTSLPAGETGAALATLPKVEAAYKLKTDMFFIRPYVGFNTYDIDGGSGDSITSWLGGFTFGVTPGPFYFKGGAFYAMNPAEYGLSGAVSATSDGISVNDVDSWGFQALAGFKINDAFTVEAGAGATAYDQDENRDIADAIDTDFDDADVVNIAYYGNATITLTPGFFIVPEIGFIDREDKGQNDDDTFYIGAKWQINF
jgi:hypothetical protein